MRSTYRSHFNHVGDYSPQDIYDFLEAYFAASPAGDANDDGTTSIQDIYDFLGEAQGGETTPGDRISGWSLFGIIDNPYGYCGYYFDHETAAAKVLGPGGGGLYSVRFRVYDPVAGRWLTRDPAGFVDGANLYEYCGGGAISCWDPMGLDDAACTGPVWHHLLPQDFRDTFQRIGLDIDSAEFGLLFEDHGTHMRGSFHGEWNLEWEKWFEKNKGKEITEKMVRKQLSDMLGMEQFQPWLKQSGITHRAWKAFQGLENEIKLKEFKAGRRLLNKIFKTGGKIAKGLGKKVPVIGTIIGIGLALAGGESVQAALVDSVLPPGVDVETIKKDMRDLEDLRDAWVEEGKQNQDEVNRRRQTAPGQKGQEPAHQQPLVPGYPE